MHYICDCVCVCISVCSYMCMGALPPSPWQGYVTLNESACFSALTYAVCSCVRMPLCLLVPRVPQGPICASVEVGGALHPDRRWLAVYFGTFPSGSLRVGLGFSMHGLVCSNLLELTSFCRD